MNIWRILRGYLTTLLMNKNSNGGNIMKRILYLSLMVIIVFSQFSYAWDGYDYDRGDYIEIEKGNLVRSGNDIEIYDYSTGTYKDVEVVSVSSDEVEVYDYEADEYRTFDME